MNVLAVRIALFSAYFLFAVLLNSVGTVILQSIASFGASKEAASVLEGFKDLPIALVSFLVASFLPRLGYRRAMVIGFAAVGAACALMPLMPSFAMTKFLFFTVGASFALVKVSVYSTIGLITRDSNEHASFLNLLEGFFMVGVLAGYWVFAAFIDPADPGSLSWLDVYWLLAAVAVANVVLLVAVKFPPAPVSRETGGLLGDFAAMLALLWKPAVLVFVISAFLYVLIEQGIGTWLPTFNNEVLHLPHSMSVQATSIFAAALAAGRLSAGFVLRRIDWYPLLNICVVAMGALILLTLPLTRDLQPAAELTWMTAPLAAFILPLVGLFMAPIYPAINSVILSALPRERHAGMAGLIVVFSALGGTTGSFITGRTFAAFGGEAAFYLSLAPMAGILAALFFLRRLTREEKAARAAAKNPAPEGAG
ncbi:MFS transporter [Amphiplicatus metriothermophilus]|uniref:Fucose permease n=1 Tax=Amphiplicatus metriothermophilus TaxID=1519374 RepID=A0A239PQK1_9PROT|nr:MFS transporter [Amphiplicatus metriothermophilus]MBB5518440.1 fucose permease [Amphiplicatus metriothermophilus]SNT72398.1 Fucose permease [Amphiplicatus metriothermophilus]